MRRNTYKFKNTLNENIEIVIRTETVGAARHMLTETLDFNARQGWVLAETKPWKK